MNEGMLSIFIFIQRFSVLRVEACLFLSQDIQQLLQLQQLVLMPGHPLQSPAQFLLSQPAQAQPPQQGEETSALQHDTTNQK